MTSVKKGKLNLKNIKEPNTIKGLISGLLPLGICFYLIKFWIEAVTPKLNQFAMDSKTPDPLLLIIITIGMVTVIYFGLIWPIEFGLWLGKKINFYKDEKLNDTTDKRYFDR